MKWFYNLRISAKLITGFIIVAIIAGIVGAVGIFNILKINNLDTELYERHTATLPSLAVVMQDYQQERVLLRDLLIVEGDELQSTVNKFKVLDASIDEQMQVFKAAIKDSSVAVEFDGLKKIIDEFKVYRDTIVDLALAGNQAQVQSSIYTDGVKIANNVQSAIDKLFDLKTDLAKQSSQTNDATAKTATMTMIIVIGVGMLIAILLGLVISRMISNPVKKMVDAADKLAVGDVNVNVESDTRDEIGQLMASFGRMVQNIRGQALAAEKIAEGDMTIHIDVKSENDLLGKKLSEMVRVNNEVLGNINSAAEQVAAGARQVSASGQILSQGSTEQASSVEEITSSMTQVAAQTKQNAINANQANELATAAKANAIQGNGQMQEMVKAMAEINDSSSNISKIIKVIDEIAFQTNILALNAAVEAARAGQHGKGFAVVAEEVRNLAARSADAAKETTTMIESSIKKVEIGTKIANETAEALNLIVDGVARAAALVGDIASASNEQASGIAQINTAIEQVAQVIQSNSSTAEESASASEELSSQAEIMKDTVRRFKLKQTKPMVQGLEDLNPDMLHMLEGLLEKKKHFSHEVGSGVEEAAASKLKISLEDRDFGKY